MSVSHNFFHSSSFDDLRACWLYNMVTANGATMNMEYKFIFEMWLSFLLNVHPEEEYLDHMIL